MIVSVNPNPSLEEFRILMANTDKLLNKDAAIRPKYYAGRGDFHIRNVTTGKEKFVITFSE